jgi:hypothetical protein
MPIFISYSHEDKDFVDRLAAKLVKHKARVWIDRWELHVGDSIIERIQDAIQESDALIVVISEASMKSEWCKRELSSGLMRELEERKVLVLPALLEKCEMPVFLRGKKYADFTKNMSDGLNDILEAVASLTSDTQGRFQEKPDYHTDWSMDWGFTNEGLYVLRLTFVDHASNVPYVVLTETSIIGNEEASKHHAAQEKEGKEWLGRYAVLLTLGDFAKEHDDLQLIIEDSFPQKIDFLLGDPDQAFYYSVIVSARRMGQDTGRDVLIDYGNHFIMVVKQLKKTIHDFPGAFSGHI